MRRTFIIRIFFLSLALLSAATPICADVFEVDGIWYSTTSPQSVCVTSNHSINGTIIIPESVTYNDITYRVTAIEGSAFYGCTGLSSVSIPNSVTFIGSSAFYGCTGLSSVSIPNSVTTIGSSAFYGCTGLSSVSIPNSVTTIESSAFSNCKSLSTISLPYALTNINDYAFYRCEKLDQVVCNAITPPTIGSYSGIYPGYYMATLYVPERSVEAYKATQYWSNFINVVGVESDDDVPQNTKLQPCDANGDGVVNIADINAVINVILNQ